MLNADLLAFVETRVHDSDLCSQNYSLNGFTAHSSSPASSVHGIAVYSKLNLEHFSVHTFSGIECAVVKTKNEHTICILYCPPTKANIENYKSFMKHLKQIIYDFRKLILIGDFNVDFTATVFTAKFFKDEYNLEQCIKVVTTDYGTCLDDVYTHSSNCFILSSGTLESYYSDHKPLYIVIKQSL